MKTKQEVLKEYKRRFLTDFDIGEHLESDFQQMIKSGQYYLYSKGVKDKYISNISWDEYGDFKNKMWNILKDENSNKTYYGFMDCCLSIPVMQDRLGFIDALDREISNELADIMFEMYKDEFES